MGYALSQLDDYLHRGEHPLVRNMNLYVCSMWVSRAERSPSAGAADDHSETASRHIEIPFDETYAVANTWAQRISREPRVPKPEGYRFVTAVDAEMHYLLKAILLRPVYLPLRQDIDETKQMLLLRAYRALCTPNDGEPSWPAVAEGPDAPGPFERGWQSFWRQQRPLVEKAQRKTLQYNGTLEAWSSPTIWNTREMEEELLEARERNCENDDEECIDGSPHNGETRRLLDDIAPGVNGLSCDSKWWPFRPMRENMLSIDEYFALQTNSIARNYDGIAQAKADKPRRKIDRDVLVPEQPLYVEGTDGAVFGGEGVCERVDASKRTTLRQNVKHAHRFDESELKDILEFNTAERRQRFVKEFAETGFMLHGELPAPAVSGEVARRREDTHERILAPFSGLEHDTGFQFKKLSSPKTSSQDTFPKRASSSSLPVHQNLPFPASSSRKPASS